MYLKLFIFLLVGNVATAAFSNGSSIGRSFTRWKELVTDEPLDLTELDDILVNTSEQSTNKSTSGPNNRSRPVPWNQVTRRYYLSEEVQSFLRGRVSTIFIPSVYALVFVISVPLNAVATVTFARKIRPMKPAVVYMLNLACADLLFALLLPFKMSYHFGGNDWTFGPGMCSLVTAAFYCNMYCSVLLIASISVDRLLAVVYPIQSLSWRSPRNAALACAGMWVLAVGGSLPLLVSRQDLYHEQLGLTTCHDVLDEDLQGRYLYFFPAFSCLLFFLPLLVTSVCYARVIWALSVVPLGVVGRSQRKARAVVMAAAVLVVFVVCFTPTNSLLVAHFLQFAEGGRAGGADAMYTAYLVSVCVGSLSCCLDPLVYYYGSSQCQRHLASVLCCRAGPKGGKGLYSGSSRSSTRTSSGTSTRITKVNAFQERHSSQCQKLLV
ncbi:proteinase-activated receptor 1-like [Osmerus eperlanus]|uniref:proteinase-activated receptor 1-like n=1 Tax=Osmerus eperlanus TaxID=29151 RepID=UPI002E165D1C